MRNRYILITGGTGGLGQGVVPQVLAAGPTMVTIPYMNRREVEHLQRSLSSAELASIQWADTNLTDETQVKALVEAMPQVDVLIHLVGGFSMAPTATYPLDQWQRDLTLNLTSTFLVCKHCLARMQTTGYGRIVTIGSGAALNPGAQMAGYAAAKAGVVTLTQAIAAETKGTQITANCVLPSLIDTPANRSAMGDAASQAGVSPQSLAQLICYLASEAAIDLRGAAIPVFGNT
jgi:NAD(P)-dependent dehydrogenase (short-subunit alcohol dehydrogenase family)